MKYPRLSLAFHMHTITVISAFMYFLASIVWGIACMVPAVGHLAFFNGNANPQNGIITLFGIAWSCVLLIWRLESIEKLYTISQGFVSASCDGDTVKFVIKEATSRTITLHGNAITIPAPAVKVEASVKEVEELKAWLDTHSKDTTQQFLNQTRELLVSLPGGGIKA